MEPEIKQQITIARIQSVNSRLLPFVRNTMGKFTAILVYIDDLLITGNSIKEIKQIKEELHKLFTIKDLGSAKYFLGLEIVRKKEGMYINQRKYILDILCWSCRC